MNQADALDIVQSALWTVIVACGPAVAAAMAVGIVIALLQALTQVQEVTLTFIPAMGVFVVTDMLGGAKYWLVGNLIQHQFGPGRNIPYGAALSLVLIALTFAGLALYRRQERSMELL